MLLTKQKNRKQIDNLKMDLEIINPIESKKVLGGDWYLDSVNVINNYHNYGGWWDNALPDNYNDPGSWDNYGSGGSPDGSPDPTFPDHICIQPQNSNTCAPISLSYIANYFGATGLTASDFAEMANQSYVDMNFGVGGLTDPDILNIMSNVFQSYAVDGSSSSIEASLSQGHPILAAIDYPNGGGGHEVVITGFDAYAGTVSFMDSLSGSLVTQSVSSINFGYLRAITGVQNNDYVNQYKNDTNDLSLCPICHH